MKFTQKEIELIEFLYEHTISNSDLNEMEQQQALSILNLKSKTIDEYIDMFETSTAYQDDDRLTVEEEKIIERLWNKISKKQTQDYLDLNKDFYSRILITQNELACRQITNK